MEVSKLKINIKCVNVIQAKLDLSQCWSAACWSGHDPWALYILGLAEFMCIVFQLCKDLQLLCTLFLLVAFILLPHPSLLLVIWQVCGLVSISTNSYQCDGAKLINW